MKRPTAYDKGQHELICKALKVSPDPDAPGNSAYESVCELLFKIDLALIAKSFRQAKSFLKMKSEDMPMIPLYGTEDKREVGDDDRIARTDDIGRCCSCDREPCAKPDIKKNHPEQGCRWWTDPESRELMKTIPLIPRIKHEKNTATKARLPG